MYQQYRHVYPSWKVYPRAYFFLDRFNDLHNRFVKLMDALPKSFWPKGEIESLGQFSADLNNDIQLIVLGRENIDNADLVCSKDERELYGESDKLERETYINILVCNLQKESLTEESCQKNVVDLINDLLMKETITSVIIKRSIGPFGDFYQDIEELKTKIQHQNIRIIHESLDLQKRISDILEKQVTCGFLKIQAILKLFDALTNECNDMKVEKDIIKGDEVTKAISDLLDVYTLKDLLVSSKVKEIDDDPVIVNQLCFAIRCAAVPPLARRYSQQFWLCNKLLHEIHFEQALADSVTQNSRDCLGKMAKKITKNSFTSHKRSQALQLKLQEDMKATFKETEKKLLGMKRISSVFKRILLETSGYIKQTNLGHAVADTDVLFTPQVSDELRRQLMSIKEVYGLGTMYGKLEIHVEQVSKDDQEKGLAHDEPYDEMNGDSVSSCVYNSYSGEQKELLYKEISVILKRHSFYHPYVIKAVKRKAKCANRSLEPGRELGSPTGDGGEMKLGTIGGYIYSDKEKVYGLTCKHVLGEHESIYVNNGKTLLGKYQGMHFIDIATIEVHSPLQEQCKKYLKTEMKRISVAQIFSEPKDTLMGKTVHKFGASTGFTKGTILTANYSSLKDLHSVVLIGPLVMEDGNDVNNDMEIFNSLLINEDTITSCTINLPGAGADKSNEKQSSELGSLRREEVIYERTKYNKQVTKELDTITSDTADLKLLDSPGNIDQSGIQGADVGQPDKKQSSKLEPLHQVSDTNCEKKSSEKLKVQEEDINRRPRNDKQVSSKGEKYVFDAKVYVREINSKTDSDDKKSLNGLFSDEGDSGAIICLPDARYHGLSCLAVSMLSGVGLKLSDDDSQKTASLMLRDGLEHISKSFNIKFQ